MVAASAMRSGQALPIATPIARHNRPAERDDEKRGAHRDVQEPVSHPGDGDQFDRYDNPATTSARLTLVMMNGSE